TAWKDNKTVLVSNGGGALTIDADPKHDWIGQTTRVLNVIYSQVVSLRTRSIVELFKLGARNGSYWGIGSDITNYGLTNALLCPLAITKKLAETPTRLAAMNVNLQEQLIDWGYAITDAAMRRWMVPDADPPVRSPYGTFQRA